MQTFLPDPFFSKSAAVLDTRRLGKQRVEAWQIIQSLTVPGYGWKHHPAVKMWRGYVPALALYGQIMCEEWRRRGHADTLLPKFEAVVRDFRRCYPRDALPMPPWLGDPRLHESHKANLVFKESGHYGPLFAAVASPTKPAYYWPPEPHPDDPGYTHTHGTPDGCPIPSVECTVTLEP